MMNRNHDRRGGCGGQYDNALLRKIQEIDFSIYDVVLYLDAYPNCREALNYYHTLLETRKTIVCEYEQKYGPLTAFSNHDRSSWNWTLTAWPWQM